MSLPKIRRELVEALVSFKHSQTDASDLVDYIEGFISAKVDEILQAREDNDNLDS